MIAARDSPAEATAFLPAGHKARVPEPSPPANADPMFFADDPTDPGAGVTYAELMGSADQRAAALDVFREAYQRWTD